MACNLPPEYLRRYGRRRPSPGPSWLLIIAAGYLLFAAVLQGVMQRNAPVDDAAAMMALTD